jgi:hypothetical protein
MDTLAELLRRLSMSLADLAALVQRVNQNALTKYNLVTVTIPAGETTAMAYHGLGHSHNGATIVACNVPVTACVDVAEDSLRIEVTLASVQLVDVTLKVLVF